jgi:hypothetical protein
VIDVLDSLETAIEHALPAAQEARAARPSSLQRFLEEDVVTDNGPWSLAGHEPYHEILDTLTRIFVKRERDTTFSFLKAEQIAATTTIGLGVGLWAPSDLRMNVGYFLPTDVFAHKFGRTRLKNTIAKSEYLRSRAKDKDAVNQATLKEFEGKYLYILGLEEMTNAISIPMDVLINDEVDLLPQDNLEWSEGRISHSDVRVQLFFSAGYAPGAGIDLRYQDGSQHKYVIDCMNRSCRRKAICLEENFPECVGTIRGEWARVCPDCKKPLDIVKNGRWVATFPQRIKQKKLSYRLSQLSVGAIDLNGVMRRWEKASKKKSKLARFRCSVLALPDAGALQPISDVELNRMQSGDVKHLRCGRGEFPRFAGVDAGDTFHFVCYERLPNGQPHLVWVEEIDSDKALERISTLIGVLGIAQLVPDKKPLTTIARGLAYRFPDIVALQDFQNSSPLKVVEEEHERKTYRCVKVDRDESLDETTSDFTDQQNFLRIPDIESDPVLAVFASHLKNLRKERTMDKKGRPLDMYLKGVSNHCGMALNSARIAEEIAPSLLPFSFTPIRRAGTGVLSRAYTRNLKRSVFGG